MTVAARIVAFAAVLVAVFAVSMWLGRTFGPDPSVAVPQPASTSQHPHAPGGNG